jgi:hypothetical protein
MTAPDLAAGREAATHPPSLAAFIGHLIEITEPDHPISPQYHLIEDLGFDAMAFNRLGVLMYERYGIGGLSTVALEPENLTVEGFFQRCILDVVGLRSGSDR